MKRGDLGAAAAVAVAAVLAVPGTRGWWFAEDDFFQVRWVAKHSFLEILGSPETWAELPMRLLTPGLFLSLKLDHALGGLTAAAYRLHQLLVWAAVAALLFLLLRLFHARLDALGGTVVALSGPAVTGLLPLLMVRHYVEGLALALTALALYVLALRRQERMPPWALLSALAFAGAALAKEVFVPLPLVLMALPVATWRRRARLAIPHAAVLLAYPLYRRFLLGEWVGGYGLAPDPADLPRLWFVLPFRLLGQAAEPGGAAATLLVGVALMALGVCLVGNRGSRLLAVALLIACLTPLLPAATSPSPRLAAVPWVALAAALPSVAAGLTPRRKAVAWSIVVGLAVATHLQAWPATRATADRLQAENQAFLRLGPSDLLRQPASPPEALFELSKWKREILGGDPGPGWYADEVHLCDKPRPPSIWQFDRDSGTVVQRTEEAWREALDHCGAIDRRAPLSARFAWRGGRLRWELGPYDQGTYRLVVNDGVVAPEMPRVASFRRESGPLSLRVRYDSPAGWFTYSERIEVAPESEIAWTR